MLAPLKDQVAIIIARQLTVVLSLILTAFRLANRNAYRLWHGTRLGSNTCAQPKDYRFGWASVQRIEHVPVTLVDAVMAIVRGEDGRGAWWAGPASGARVKSSLRLCR